MACDFEIVNENPPAFPCRGSANGMTLRDWFAGQALAALRIDREFIERSTIMQLLPEEHAARICFGIADAMLAARKETPDV